MIRILLVDDHYILRAGVAAIIAGEPDLSVVGEAEDCAGAVSAFRELRPDVVVMDVRMPGRTGIEAVSEIISEAPQAAILVLSTYDSEEEIYKALAAGARGYLLKSVPGDELLDAIRAIHAGRRCIPPAIATRLAERMTYSNLTGREIEVLRLVAKGNSNKEIAAALRITEGTVKAHMVNVLTKLGVDDRTQATTVALRRGIIRMD